MKNYILNVFCKTGKARDDNTKQISVSFFVKNDILADFSDTKKNTLLRLRGGQNKKKV